jgi:PAS domain S-box-containing protein
MEEKLRLNFKLLDMVSDSIILLDVRGKMVYANKTAAKSRGYNLESFLELQMKDLYPKYKTNYVRKQLAEEIKSGEKVFEVENLTKNGETRWFSVKVIPVKIDQDKYILKICRSIKEKQEIQKAEALAKEQSQKLLEGASRVTFRGRNLIWLSC